MSNAENVDAIDYDALALAGDLYADHLCGNEEYEPADLVQRMATTIRTLRAALAESERDVADAGRLERIIHNLNCLNAYLRDEDDTVAQLAHLDDVKWLRAMIVVAPSQTAEFIGMDKGSGGGCAIWSAAIREPATGEWVVHVIGPDDVMSMPDELTALREANGINVAVTRNERQQHDPIVIAMAKKRDEL